MMEEHFSRMQVFGVYLTHSNRQSKNLMEIKVVKIMMTHGTLIYEHSTFNTIHILHTLFHDLYKFEQSI